jgi:hypothetical protein
VPSQVNEFAADATTVLRYSQTDYMNDPYYNVRRIIGLPTEQRLYDGSNVLQSKVGYLYDSTIYWAHASIPSQHDNTIYNDGFYTRGNLTNVLRYDVTGSAYTETQTDYYVTGNPSATRDALNHETKILYTDSFATYADDAANTATPVTPTTATYAYPTDIEDAEHYHSKLKYWYATGANTRAENPLGAVSLNIYEMQYFGRPIKSKNTVNGAYTRYEYSTDHNWFRTWTTVNSLTEETANLNILDGASRARVNVTDHPGSVGGLTLSYKVFDLMGRVVEWSNPTEINNQPTCGQLINGVQQDACWIAYGDDVAGFNYSRQEYDWKGRPTITYNQDYNVNTNPNSKRTVSYEGCGCAGTQTVTSTDEMLRVQKAYADILGRFFKTEIWNGSAVYSTQLNAFNVRDQVTSTTESAGTSGSSRTGSFTYDGHGRLMSELRPIEGVGSLGTRYTYFADDTQQTVTDPRNVIATYSYNSRALLTGVSFNTGNATNIPSVSPITFTYDSTGNRLTMNDATGSHEYHYNSLSQMDWEKQYFNGITRDFTTEYQYNLVGEPTQIKDPFGDYIYNSYDKAGRVQTVTGSSYASVTQYSSNTLPIKYRAWGALKEMTYGNNLKTQVNYNSKLLVKNFDVTGQAAGYGPSTVMQSEHTYYNDGSIFYSKDTTAATRLFDRAYEFDFAKRLKKAYTGYEARVLANQSNNFPNSNYSSYKQDYQYNEWGDTTQRDSVFWSNSNTFNATFDTTTGRKQDINWSYDIAGNPIQDKDLSHQFDARGFDRVSERTSAPVTEKHKYTQWQDGNGQVVKREESWGNNGTYTNSLSTYYLYSTVLGGKLLSNVTSQGQKSIGYVYAGNQLIAKQDGGYATTPPLPPTVKWQHSDPVAGKEGYSLPNGYYQKVAEYDPLGVNIGFSDPYNAPPPAPIDDYIGLSLEQPGKCTLDGIAYDCVMISHLIAVGAAVYSPENNVRYNDRTGGLEIFHAYADGAEGYLPVGASYQGNGYWSWSNPSKAKGGYGKDGESDGKFGSSQSFKQQLKETLAGITSTPCRALFGILQPSEIASANKFIDEMTIGNYDDNTGKVPGTSETFAAAYTRLHGTDNTAAQAYSKTDPSVKITTLPYKTVILGAAWNNLKKAQEETQFMGKSLEEVHAIVRVHEYTHDRYEKNHKQTLSEWNIRDSKLNSGSIFAAVGQKHGSDLLRNAVNGEASASKFMDYIISYCIGLDK